MKKFNLISDVVLPILYGIILPIFLTILFTIILVTKLGFPLEIIFILAIFFVMCPVIFGNIEPIGKINHDLLGWHKPDDNEDVYTDSFGVNTHAVCKYCHKEIMQDSQGNWF